jgi:galactose mutarotase-like enzyme
LTCEVSTDRLVNGIEATSFDNDDLRVVVLQGKGTDISEVTYKPLKLNLLFRNPWGPKNPLLHPNVSPHGQTFRDYTGGGWSDIIPNAGDECEAMGARFGLHDETPLLRWSASKNSRSRRTASASFAVALNKYPFRVRKRVTLDSRNNLKIVESIENASEQSLPYSWLIHPTFSWGFVGSGARIDTSAESISRMDSPAKRWKAPRFVDSDGKTKLIGEVPDGGSTLDSTLVLGDLSEGRYEVTNTSLGLSFELSWDRNVFPYLWYYRSINAPNYPYFGRSRFIALEPCTSRYSGLAKQVEESDAPALGPRKSLTTTFAAKVRKVGPSG